MNAVAELPRDDDSPPPSGVRLRAFAFPVPSPIPAAVGSATGALPPEPDVLAEVAEEVFLQTWEVVRVLSPLQGSWLKLGLGHLEHLGAAVSAVGAGAWRGARRGEPRLTAKVLHERWPELVPGYAAMDCLAGVMVDAIC